MAKIVKPDLTYQWASAGNIVAIIDDFIFKRKF